MYVGEQTHSQWKIDCTLSYMDILLTPLPPNSPHLIEWISIFFSKSTRENQVKEGKFSSVPGHLASLMWLTWALAEHRGGGVDWSSVAHFVSTRKQRKEAGTR